MDGEKILDSLFTDISDCISVIEDIVAPLNDRDHLLNDFEFGKICDNVYKIRRLLRLYKIQKEFKQVYVKHSIETTVNTGTVEYTDGAKTSW